MAYCINCGAKTKSIIPPMDNRVREVCSVCSYVHYVNPNNIVGVIGSFEGKVLLCKRNTEPRKDYWTVPAGFMENGESLLEGAQREAKEEVGIEPVPSNLFMVYSVPHISQVHFYFYSKLKDQSTTIGDEINDVMFAAYKDIPWDDLAFKSIRVLLEHFFEVGEEKAANSFFNLTSNG